MKTESGFTLAEVAIAMVIVALVLGAALVPLGSQQELRNRRETAAALAGAEEALIGFALAHGRLPCPASPTVASGSGGICPLGGSATVAGCEATVGTGGNLACAAAAGVLPWATLGLPETDAWGRRYAYRVSPLFARGVSLGQTEFGDGCVLNPPDHSRYDATLGDGPRQAAFALCSPGTISVFSTAGGTTLARDLPAIVVSHGPNGRGAYTPEGTRLPVATGDEADNADDDDDFTLNTAVDDQLLWIPRGLLMSRMLVAGKLP